jgi:hypothetical protein
MEAAASDADDVEAVSEATEATDENAFEPEDGTFRTETTKAVGEADGLVVTERRDEDDGSNEEPATC